MLVDAGSRVIGQPPARKHDYLPNSAALYLPALRKASIHGCGSAIHGNGKSERWTPMRSPPNTDHVVGRGSSWLPMDTRSSAVRYRSSRSSEVRGYWFLHQGYPITGFTGLKESKHLRPENTMLRYEGKSPSFSAESMPHRPVLGFLFEAVRVWPTSSVSPLGHKRLHHATLDLPRDG
ncbi:hypothetical protein N656DRAFT_557590 [Canariomyces notabilis]|uniref:Uncharacterized protein n=1 Tax=Canariomyces notabilis TaxID=2074819 RepID=A0AAN6TIA1_9PEZI|nr:hypothetical protein N656DRAFT_557590 [Canariomyces arenarius]